MEMLSVRMLKLMLIWSSYKVLMQARQLLETVSSAYADSLVAGCIKQINREIPQSVLPNDN